jgi:hypothetical protein
MLPQPGANAALRRFRRVQFVAMAIKVAALLGLVVFIAVYFGGL